MLVALLVTALGFAFIKGTHVVVVLHVHVVTVFLFLDPRAVIPSP